MATAERVLWETITVVAFLILLVGTVLWSSARVDRRQARLEEEFASRMAVAQEENRATAQRLEEDFAERAHEFEVEEARAIFRSFESGIRSAVTSRWGNYVSSAKSHLLEETKVTFVHILTPSGLVLSSSDEKLARGGRIDERGEWALAANEVTARDGALEGLIEIAGPVGGSGRPVAFLWLGYDPTGGSVDQPSP